VFKAKYFSIVDFLEVSLGHNLSYVWPNIHASQVVINEGTRWRVGNGKKKKSIFGTN